MDDKIESINISETCRLCLRTSKKLNVLDEVIQLKLNSFLLYPNLISDESLICKICLDNLEHCMDFKTKCLPNETHMVGGECNENNLQLKQEIGEDEIEQKFIPNVQDASNRCSFCRQSGKSSVTALDDCDIEILQVHLPSSEFVIMENPRACISCYDSLRHFVNFIKTCLHCENKIIEYCKVENVDYKGQVDLSKVTSFIPKEMVEDKLTSIKLEIDDVECEQNAGLKQEFNPSNIKLEREDDQKTDPLGIDSQAVNVSTTQKVYKCELCPYTSKTSFRIKAHFITHQNISEVTTYSCAQCPFKSKYKKSLVIHMRIHSNSTKKPFKCEFCDYRARRKDHIKKHLKSHATKPLKCSDCNFETKYLKNLNAHMVLHNDPEKSATFASHSVTRHKTLAEKHKLSHISEGELSKTGEQRQPETDFKCYVCEFEAETKPKLRIHIKEHKPILDTGVYKCKFCTYTTRERICLRRHMNNHGISTFTKHRCEMCNFETNQANSLRTHMQLHGCPPIPRHKCPDCDYSTTHTNSLQKHLLVHKSVEELTMFTCYHCEFKSKRKTTLSTHMLKHRSADEVQMYECMLCDYKSKRKDVLRQHMKTHQSIDEVVSYKCDFCEHRTMRKEHMRLHVLTHKSKSEVELFKCEWCSFDTKYKNHFQKHDKHCKHKGVAS